MRSRGEFKTPGGKLIAVEFDVVDGELRNVVVTGDFFLYPEEALPILAGALEKSPATLDEAGYAARVQTALDASAELGRVISGSAGGGRGPRAAGRESAGTRRSWLTRRRLYLQPMSQRAGGLCPGSCCRRWHDRRC